MPDGPDNLNKEEVRLAVVSDTHGDLSFLAGVDARSGHRPDALIHLGDMESTGWIPGMPERIPVLAVSGNNDDFRHSFPMRRVFTAAGMRIVCVHGHQQHVRQGLTGLNELAAETQADLVLFGHTHRYQQHVELRPDGKPTLYLNPGAAYGYGLRKDSGFVLLCIRKDWLSIRRMPHRGADTVLDFR